MINATHIISGGHKVPNYKKFMINSANKEALASFISDFIISAMPKVLKNGQYVILAGSFGEGILLTCVTKHDFSELPDLFCSHKEADKRIILHAIDFCTLFEWVVVYCDDTDVLVLLLYYVSNGMLGPVIYMYAGYNADVTMNNIYL